MKSHDWNSNKCNQVYLSLWEYSSFSVSGMSSSNSSCSWLRGCPLAWTTVNKTSCMLSCHALYSSRNWRTLPSYITSSPSAKAASSSCMTQGDKQLRLQTICCIFEVQLNYHFHFMLKNSFQSDLPSSVNSWKSSIVKWNQTKWETPEL